MSFMGHEVSPRLLGLILLVLAGSLLAYTLKSGEFVVNGWHDNVKKQSDPLGYWVGVGFLVFCGAGGIWLIYSNHF